MYCPHRSRLAAAARLQSTQAYSNGGTVLHSEWINSNTNSNSNEDDDEMTNNDNHTLVFLHGLLGSGHTVQTMAKKMCALTDRQFANCMRKIARLQLFK
jgi:predicted alpha/beta-fold hydrolase